MFLSYLTLLVALSLSVIAAFYSIAGLAAIFSAAVLPIIVMGSILELAKIVVTVWLHEYWRQCRFLMKLYLVPAVFTLMLITSMGIFGFLSKAHSDQNLVSGDVRAKLLLVDEKIKIERDNIANAREVIKQLDDAVNGINAKGSDREIKLRDGSSYTRSAAEQALQVRRSQAKDRAKLTKEIETAQNNILKLQEEAAPIRAETRKVEAEVGPIKYIAALIYDDNPDANLMEKAVRWVIITLVAVFDPLAIMMLLAATESLAWEKQRRREKQLYAADDGALTQQQVDQITESVDPAPPAQNFSQEKPFTQWPWPTPWPKDTVVQTPTAATVEPVVNYLDPDIRPDQQSDSQKDPVVEEETKPVNEDFDDIDDIEIQDQPPRLKAAIMKWKNLNPNNFIKVQRGRLLRGEIDELPWIQYIDWTPIFTFGNKTPTQPVKGDTWIKTSAHPWTLQKFNGTEWIELDKNINDSYTLDTNFIDYLIVQLSNGKYNTELLTESEQQQITQRLNSNS